MVKVANEVWHKSSRIDRLISMLVFVYKTSSAAKAAELSIKRRQKGNRLLHTGLLTVIIIYAFPIFE